MQEEWVSPTFRRLTVGEDHVSYAYAQIGYESVPEGEFGPEGVTQRWGGLDVELLARAIQEGQKEDRLLAIFALGYHQTRWVAELLLPFLESPLPQERWASALSLGFMQEERAFPVLLNMLTEFLPPSDWPTYQGGDLWMYNVWREQVIEIIAEYNKSGAVTSLLHALRVYQNIEQSIPDYNSSRDQWTIYLRKVVYALGGLGKFDILPTGVVMLQVPWEWNVYLALGFLHAHIKYPYFYAFSWEKYPGFKERVARVLAEQLDRSEEEAERYMKDFSKILRKW